MYDILKFSNIYTFYGIAQKVSSMENVQENVDFEITYDSKLGVINSHIARDNGVKFLIMNFIYCHILGGSDSSRL